VCATLSSQRTKKCDTLRVVSCHNCCICPRSYQLLTKLTGTAAEASPPTPQIILNLKFHYRVHCSPTLSQTNPFHIVPFHFLKVQFNVIVPSLSRSSKWSLFFRFLYHFASSPYLPPVPNSAFISSISMKESHVLSC
jgi:hypothetical protein